MDNQAALPGEADRDRKVLARVAAGDAEAFGFLVDRHQRRLLHLCERILGNPEDARDAAQEVFLKVYRKAATFQPRGQVFTWLYRIATNHCLNQLRRRRIVRFVGLSSGSDEAPCELDPPDSGVDPEAALEIRQAWHRTRLSMSRLPANQRVVLVLAKFEGLTYREIAEVLEISEGAVESRLFRAMRRLTQERSLSSHGENAQQ
ncbi:MAG: sigma-70 family RNA polymerase sigma factor [Deltaproteobacteria bacterium]|nr:sigma-70 family RNA polymerase sigma factor [Deltaproteobacteria bacterium]